jgi:hypothetical protein
MKNVPYKYTTLALGVASALVFGIAPSANAATVTGITIQDVGRTVSGAYSATLDNRAGLFRFGALTAPNYQGSSAWTGDVGTGTLLGEGAANPSGSFTSGFLFAGFSFVPYTYGNGFNADITDGALTISTLDFGGTYWGGGSPTNFNLALDPATLHINWVIPVANTSDYLVSFQWEHTIDSVDDPSGVYAGLKADWLIEGVAHTAVPVPAAVWLFGSGLVGLFGVGYRKSVTRNGISKVV